MPVIDGGSWVTRSLWSGPEIETMDGQFPAAGMKVTR